MGNKSDFFKIFPIGKNFKFLEIHDLINIFSVQLERNYD